MHNMFINQQTEGGILNIKVDKCNSPLRMSKMKNCKKLDNQAKTRLNQGFLRI